MSETLNLSDDKKELLLIAGWFHDIGYFEKEENHEVLSAEIAEEYLKSLDYPFDKIQEIKKLILATKFPPSPANLYEQIICDADLHHLGKSDFEERGELFRKELEKKGICNLSDIEWNEKTLKFLQLHTFYTDFAKTKYKDQKKINMQLIEEKLRKLNNI